MEAPPTIAKRVTNPRPTMPWMLTTTPRAALSLLVFPLLLPPLLPLPLLPLPAFPPPGVVDPGTLVALGTPVTTKVASGFELQDLAAAAAEVDEVARGLTVPLPPKEQAWAARLLAS